MLLIGNRAVKFRKIPVQFWRDLTDWQSDCRPISKSESESRTGTGHWQCEGERVFHLAQRAGIVAQLDARWRRSLSSAGGRASEAERLEGLSL